MRHLKLLALLPALAAGCTAVPSRSPSLLPRAIESRSTAEIELPVPVAAPDATLDARIATLTGQVDKALAGFATAARTAEARVALARGMAKGSEAWVAAQTAMADLDQTRGAIIGAVADLERLAIDRAQAGQPPYPALDAALTDAEVRAAAQEARIALLETALTTD